MKRGEDESIILEKPQRQQAVLYLQQWFRDERDEEIGNLQSEMLLDYLLERIGPFVYNAAISDMQRFLLEKVEESYILLHDEYRP